jgi:hypothetical protein
MGPNPRGIGTWLVISWNASRWLRPSRITIPSRHTRPLLLAYVPNMAERQAFGANLIAGLDHDRRGIPYVRVRGIGENMTVRGSDADVAQPALPAIRVGDGVCRVSRHDRWSRNCSGVRAKSSGAKRKLVAQARPQLAHYVAASAAALAPSAARETSARAQTLTS